MLEDCTYFWFRYQNLLKLLVEILCLQSEETQNNPVSGR